MALISSNVPNLVGGVSQQPSPIRRNNQFEEQLNVYGTVVDGLRKRPPAIHIAKLLDDTVGSTAFVHCINRDQNERYEVIVHDDDLRVFDNFSGQEKTVSFPNGKSYLAATNWRDEIRMLTVADFTFVVNQSITTALTSDLTPTANPDALVSIKQGNYGKTYTVSIDGVMYASYKTKDGGSSSDSEKIDTTYIARQLYKHLTGVSNEEGTAPPATLSGYTVVQYQNTLHIQHDSSTDFAIATTDGFSNLAMRAIKGSVQLFTDLPSTGPDGFVVEVAGDKGKDGDNYFLKFVKKNLDDSSGVWKETVKPGVKYKHDRATMPHQLVRQADGTFVFQEAEWEDREVGDDKTNPEPSFVGVPITDVFFDRNRLGFIAGENVVFSRSAAFFNFWRRTVTELLDDDPVDTAVSHVKVSTLFHALPFNKNLLLFSEQTQFELGAEQLLTPKSVVIAATTEFEASRRAKPVGAAASVFFAVEQDGFAQIREYYFDGDQREEDAYNTTAHCPRYIPSGVFKMTASTTEDVLLVVTAADPGAVYCYKWLADPTQRVQSAWTRWEVGGIVLNIDFIDSDLYMVVERDGAVWLEKVPLSAGKVDPGVAWLTYLDRRVSSADLPSPTYYEAQDVTAFTLPYTVEGTDVIGVVRWADGYTALAPGVKLHVTDRSGPTLTVKGDHRDTPLFFGEPYMSRATLSTIYRKDTVSQNGSQVTVVEGRLQLRHITFLIGNTAFFKVSVTPSGRPSKWNIFNGRIIGAAQTVVGAVPLTTGRYRVPVRTRADGTTISIINDSYLPMSLLAMEWEGMFVSRSQRA